MSDRPKTEKGFVLFHRKFWDNPILKEPGKPYSKREAWLYLFSNLANGIDRNGVPRGQFVVSIRYLSKRWIWPKSNVSRFIALLEKEGMIKRLSCNPVSVGHLLGQSAGHFSICNYETYQNSRDTKWDTKWDKSKESITKQRISNTSTIVDADDSLLHDEAWQLAESLRKAIEKRDAKSKAATLPIISNKWAIDIDKILRIDKRPAKDIEQVIQWTQAPGCFWGPNIQSGKKLREKFDVLYGQMQRDKTPTATKQTPYTRDQIGATPEDTPPMDEDYKRMMIEKFRRGEI